MTQHFRPKAWHGAELASLSKFVHIQFRLSYQREPHAIPSATGAELGYAPGELGDVLRWTQAWLVEWNSMRTAW